MASVDSKGLPHDAPSVTLTIRLLMAGKVSSISFPSLSWTAVVFFSLNSCFMSARPAHLPPYYLATAVAGTRWIGP